MKKKSKLLIVALVLILLVFGIAYASFTGILNITGRANASGNFEVIFTNGVVSTSDHGTAQVNSVDNTKMNANIELSYPGDGCYVTATIKNNGDVPAALTGFNIYNQSTTETFTNDDIEILAPNLDTSGTGVLQAGESCTLTFTVKWKKESTKESAVADFDIELDYEQTTDEFTGTALINNK